MAAPAAPWPAAATTGAAAPLSRLARSTSPLGMMLVSPSGRFRPPPGAAPSGPSPPPSWLSILWLGGSVRRTSRTVRAAASGGWRQRRERAPQGQRRRRRPRETGSEAGERAQTSGGALKTPRGAPSNQLGDAMAGPPAGDAAADRGRRASAQCPRASRAASVLSNTARCTPPVAPTRFPIRYSITPRIFSAY